MGKSKMTLEKFKEIIELQQLFHKKSHEINKLGIDLTEISESLEKAVDLLWKDILTKEGDDWLSWMVFEKCYCGECREDLKAWDENGVEIIKDVDELYEYLVGNKYFR